MFRLPVPCIAVIVIALLAGCSSERADEPREEPADPGEADTREEEGETAREQPEAEQPEADPDEAEPEAEQAPTEEPGTTAPGTAAPGTAAPETAAPETAAPETAAPETAAPEPETAETAPTVGRVVGRALYSGGSRGKRTKVTKQTEVCGETQFTPVVAAGGGGVRLAVAVLDGVRGGSRRARASAQVSQRGCVFRPHTQAVRAGGQLTVSNGDDVLHNVHAYLDGSRTLFNIAMPIKGMQIHRPLSRPGVVSLKCDAGHTWMAAYIYVVGHAYFALTGAGGRFVIDRIPPGRYTLRGWHEALRASNVQVEVRAGEDTTASLTFR